MRRGDAGAPIVQRAAAAARRGIRWPRGLQPGAAAPPERRARSAPRGDYVLYWMQAYRRLERNHALDYALRCAEELGRPLVVYEGLRVDYPWASRRLHRFVLEGMAGERRACRRSSGSTTGRSSRRRQGEGRGLLRRLAERACLVVTDDFPCFIVPGAGGGARPQASTSPVFAVDSNCARPAVAPRCRGVRRGSPAPAHPQGLRRGVGPPLPAGRSRAVPRSRAARRGAVRDVGAGDVGAFVGRLPLDGTVPAVAGDRRAARRPRGARLRAVRRRSACAATPRTARSRARPTEGHASGLCPYLHFGHISIEEVVEAVLATTGRWTPDELRVHNRGKREGFFSDDADVNAFLDEALTWRDVGFNWHCAAARRHGRASRRRSRRGRSQTLGAHAARPAAVRLHARGVGGGRDARPAVERRPARARRDRHASTTTCACSGARRCSSGRRRPPRRTAPSSTSTTSTRSTAATRTPTPASSGASACSTGRGRRSGRCSASVRYMSSDNTARKFDLKPYYRYVETLPTIEAARSGA